MVRLLHHAHFDNKGGQPPFAAHRTKVSRAERLCENSVQRPLSSRLFRAPVYPGFADLIVLSEGRVLFLEVKSKTGRLSPAQVAFRDTVQMQGFAWALVRSVDDALVALADHGFTTRVRHAQRNSHIPSRPRRAAP